jgi:hypothetical protein
MDILESTHFAKTCPRQMNWIDSKSEIIHIKRKYSQFSRTPEFSNVHRLSQFRVKNSDNYKYIGLVSSNI